MSIASNIRRLRTEKKMTQDELAAKINVSRQAVSSWENNRTQPGIDMLGMLAEVLDADIEELIYGKKKNIGFEEPEKKHRKRITVMLSVFGGVLTGIGVIFVFIWMWDKMPGVFKKSLAFIPEAVFAAFGLTAVFRKEKRQSVTEPAAILWAAGIMTTNALVNSMFSVDFGFENILLADIILILLVACLLSSVAVTAGLHVMLSVFIADAVSGDIFVIARYPVFIAAAAVLAVVPYRLTAKELRKYTVWLSVISGATCVSLLLADTGFYNAAVYGFVFPLIAAAFLSGRQTEEYPFGNLSLVLVPVFSVIFTAFNGEPGDYGWNTSEGSVIAGIAAATVLFIIAVITGRKNYASDKGLLAMTGCAVLLAFTALIPGSGDDSALFPAVCCVTAFAAGIILIVRGTTRSKLLWFNLGMLTVIAESLVMTIGLFGDMSALFAGIFLFVSGAALLVSNKILTKRFAAEKQTEVTENA